MTSYFEERALMLVYQCPTELPNEAFSMTFHPLRPRFAPNSWAREILVALVCISILPFLGCKNDDQSRNIFKDMGVPDAAPAPSVKPDRKLVVARSDELPERPARIVSMAPNITEILFAIGAGERLVGVTRYCDFPRQVDEIDEIGGIVDPDPETIASLRPDLLIGLTSSGNSEITSTLDNLGVPYVFLRMENLAETIDGIALMGELVANERPALKLAGSMKDDLEAFESMKAPSHKPSVLLVFGRDPLVVAGPGTFADDLIQRAHGVNVIDGPNPYPKLDIEKVLELDPDRIIDVSMNPNEESGIDFWKRHKSLEAVKHGNVYRFTDEALMRPGPRLIDGFRRVAMAIKGKHGNH